MGRCTWAVGGNTEAIKACLSWAEISGGERTTAEGTPKDGLSKEDSEEGAGVDGLDPVKASNTAHWGTVHQGD